MRLDLRLACCAALVGACVPVAHAGGPLYIDTQSMKPVAYPNATPVRVYTDLGRLGVLDSQAIGAQVANAFAQWTNVETSDFEATIAGDFATIGLPDIVAQNASSVIGKDNGGNVRFDRQFDTFVGVAKNNPTITFDLAPSDAGVDAAPLDAPPDA